jgi:ATP-dependent exoDNAse (exonuclease V) beta subunit
MIHNNNDINQSLEIAESKNIIEQKERKFFKNFFDKLFKIENIRKFFNPKNISFNEVEILNDKGDVYRLDRVVEMSDNLVYVIDYKTGEIRDSYIKQVENYKDLLSEIYSKEIKGLLIYVDSNKTIEI